MRASAVTSCEPTTGYEGSARVTRGSRANELRGNNSPGHDEEQRAPGEAQGTGLGGVRFPLTTHAEPGSNVLGIGVIARPDDFMAWARKQDASPHTEGKTHYTEEEWAKEASRLVGLIRHNPKNVGFKYSCEFWTPPPRARWTTSSRERSGGVSTEPTFAGG